MSNLVEKELKFKLVKEQLEDGCFNEPYIEVEIGNGEYYIRVTSVEQLIEDILEYMK